MAVTYREYWYDIDDGDAQSRITFSLMLTVMRLNLSGIRKGSPALTLPVGRSRLLSACSGL